MSNPIKDKHGREIKEGDTVKYYDSTTMWLTGKIIDVGSCLAVETDENPIRLHEFAWPRHIKDYSYDGTPIAELEIVTAAG